MTLRPFFPCLIYFALMLCTTPGLCQDTDIEPCDSYECDIMALGAILDSNGIQSDIDIAAWPSRSNRLEHLYFQDSNVTSKMNRLPDDILKLNNLTGLYIKGWGSDRIPDVIFKLKGLTRLDFVNSGITAIPDEIANLSNLEVLNLSGNQLISIPSSMASLKNLLSLMVFNNKLDSLPASIATIPALRFLYADSCELKNVPPGFFKKDSLELSLYGNQLCHFDTNLIETIGIHQFQSQKCPSADSFILARMPYDTTVILQPGYLEMHHFNFSFPLYHRTAFCGSRCNPTHHGLACSFISNDSEYWWTRNNSFKNYSTDYGKPCHGCLFTINIRSIVFNMKIFDISDWENPNKAHLYFDTSPENLAKIKESPYAKKPDQNPDFKMRFSGGAISVLIKPEFGLSPSLTLFDLAGHRILKKGFQEISQNLMQCSFKTNNLDITPGLYCIRISGKEKSLSEPILIPKKLGP